MTNHATSLSLSERPEIVVPRPTPLLTASLLPVLETAVAAIRAHGEDIGGRIPASRVVWGVIEWIDHCMAEGYGLQALRVAIVEAAQLVLGEFSLSYQSLRSYRSMLSARMQGGTVARVQALTGRPVVARKLHPSPRAASNAREAARRDAEGGPTDEALSPVERVLNAIDYGRLGQAMRSANAARLMIRQVSLVVESKAVRTLGAMCRALSRPKAAAVPATSEMSIAPRVMPQSRPESIGSVRESELAMSSDGVGFRTTVMPSTGAVPPLLESPEELDRKHRAELGAMQAAETGKLNKFIAMRNAANKPERKGGFDSD